MPGRGRASDRSGVANPAACGEGSLPAGQRRPHPIGHNARNCQLHVIYLLCGCVCRDTCVVENHEEGRTSWRHARLFVTPIALQVERRLL